MCDGRATKQGRPGAFKGFKELHRSTSAFVDTISSSIERKPSTAHQTKIATLPSTFLIPFMTLAKFDRTYGTICVWVHAGKELRLLRGSSPLS